MSIVNNFEPFFSKKIQESAKVIENNLLSVAYQTMDQAQFFSGQLEGLKFIINYYYDLLRKVHLEESNDLDSFLKAYKEKILEEKQKFFVSSHRSFGIQSAFEEVFKSLDSLKDFFMKEIDSGNISVDFNKSGDSSEAANKDNNLQG